MSKKLLSEAQVRKFMGLANLDANVSSNFIQEMYHAKMDDEEVEEGLNLGDKHKGTAGQAPAGKDPHDAMRKKDEGMHDKKEEDMHKEDMHAEGAHEEAELEVDAEGGDEGEEAEEAADVDVMLSQDEVEDAMSELDNAHKKLSNLLGKLMGDEGAPEMDDDLADEPDMAMDAELDLDAEDEVELQEKDGMNEEEMIQEVAKRVAQRINKAARAQKKTDK